MAVIGIDLGGTKLAGAVFSDQGKVLHRATTTLEGRQGGAVGELIRRQIGGLLHVARKRAVQVSSVGVSVPGINDSLRGRVWAPNIPGWQDYPLRREVESALRGFGSTPHAGRIPVVIDCDRACSVLGEAWLGRAKGCRNAIFLAVGTGIGAGILVDGRVLRGAHDVAGSIGWMALDRPYRSEYIGCGCFEYHASGAGLAKVASELDGKPALRRAGNSDRAGRRKQGAGITGEEEHGWEARDIFAAYERGDTRAREVIGQAIEFWGMAVANLVSLFNPEKIIFGGGVFGPAAKFLAAIRAEAVKWAQPISMRHVILQTAKLGADAALYGAGKLALEATRSACHAEGHPA